MGNLMSDDYLHSENPEGLYRRDIIANEVAKDTFDGVVLPCYDGGNKHHNYDASISPNAVFDLKRRENIERIVLHGGDGHRKVFGPDRAEYYGDQMREVFQAILDTNFQTKSIFCSDKTGYDTENEDKKDGQAAKSENSNDGNSTDSHALEIGAQEKEPMKERVLSVMEDLFVGICLKGLAGVKASSVLGISPGDLTPSVLKSHGFREKGQIFAFPSI